MLCWLSVTTTNPQIRKLEDLGFLFFFFSLVQVLLPGPQTWLRVLAAWWRREPNAALSKCNKELMVSLYTAHDCVEKEPIPHLRGTNTNVLLHRWENILNVYLKEGILVYKDKWFWNYADSYIIKQIFFKKQSLTAAMDLDSSQLLHITQRNYKQLPNTNCTSLVGATFKTGRSKTNKQKELRLFSAIGRFVTTWRCAMCQAEVGTMVALTLRVPPHRSMSKEAPLWITLKWNTWADFQILI